MKQFILLLAFILTTSLSPLALGNASAVNILRNCGVNATNNGQGNLTPDVCTEASNQTGSNTDNPVIGLLRSAIQIITVVIGIAAVIGVLVSSIRIITANGDSNAVASARSSLIYSLIGVAVA